jgi:hypothetical protein
MNITNGEDGNNFQNAFHTGRGQTGRTLASNTHTSTKHSSKRAHTSSLSIQTNNTNNNIIEDASTESGDEASSMSPSLAMSSLSARRFGTHEDFVHMDSPYKQQQQQQQQAKTANKRKRGGAQGNAQATSQPQLQAHTQQTHAQPTHGHTQQHAVAAISYRSESSSDNNRYHHFNNNSSSSNLQQQQQAHTQQTHAHHGHHMYAHMEEDDGNSGEGCADDGNEGGSDGGSEGEARHKRTMR